tara:strand:+ start:6904 stop:9945 length:3042 start_codon:yes stop_codon:yes gene_type:complete
MVALKQRIRRDCMLYYYQGQLFNKQIKIGFRNIKAVGEGDVVNDTLNGVIDIIYDGMITTNQFNAIWDYDNKYFQLNTPGVIGTLSTSPVLRFVMQDFGGLTGRILVTNNKKNPVKQTLVINPPCGPVDYIWSGTKQLNEPFFLSCGQSLTINPGTQIICNKGMTFETTGMLIIQQGATFKANGTKISPIVFKAKDLEENSIAKGRWGGIVVLGEDTDEDIVNGFNKDDSLSKYEERFTYGKHFSNYADDMTYTKTFRGETKIQMKYITIKNCGYALDTNNGIGALSLYGISDLNENSISNIQILHTDYNGIHIVGGSLSMNDIVVKNSHNNNINISKSYMGVLSNTVLLERGNLFINIENSTPPIYAMFNAKADEPLIQGETWVNNDNNEITLLDNDFDNTILIWGSIYETDTRNTNLVAIWSNTVLLDKPYFVKQGQTLTIEPGTVIKCKKGTEFENTGMLIVEQGGTLNAIGSNTHPILFISKNDPEFSNATGSWGGIILLGEEAALNTIPGFSNVGSNLNLTYSEKMSYGKLNKGNTTIQIEHIVIRHSGQEISPGYKCGGLVACGIAKNSTNFINNIQILYSNNNGLELLNGSISITNLVVNNCKNANIFVNEGYEGILTNVITINKGNYFIEGGSSVIPSYITLQIKTDAQLVENVNWRNLNNVNISFLNNIAFNDMENKFAHITNADINTSYVGKNILNHIRNKGKITIGINEFLKGFGFKYSLTDFVGFYATFGKILADVIGVSSEFIAVSESDAFTKLEDREIDILCRNTEINMELENTARSPITWFYDGQGFMVKKSLGLNSINDIVTTTNPINIGVIDNTSDEYNVIHKQTNSNSNITIQIYNNANSLEEGILNNTLHVITANKSVLGSIYATLNNAEQDTVSILEETLNTKPCGPYIMHNESELETIVLFVYNVLIAADKYGLTSLNIDDAMIDNGHVGKAFLDKDIYYKNLLYLNKSIYNIIKEYGSYSELYCKYVKEVGLTIDYNKNFLTNGLLISGSF